MDENNNGAANGNGKKWLQKVRTSIADVVFSWPALFISVLVISASTAYYYNNQFGIVAVIVYFFACGYWSRHCRYAKFLLAVVTGITLLSNVVLMDIFPRWGDRVAVIEGINQGRSIMLKRFQPTFFFPKFYTVFYYDLDQSLETDCDGRLKTADGDDFPAKISARLNLINDQAVVSMMHDKAQGQEHLQATLKTITCAVAQAAIGKMRSQKHFGGKRLLTDENISGKLRYLMTLQGVRLEEDLLIENLTVMPLELKEENKDPT